MDETGAYYTEWSKSQRKTPIQYINAYIWNLERWSQWPNKLKSMRQLHIQEWACGPRTDEKVFAGDFWEKIFSSLCCHSNSMTNQPPIFLIQSEETCRSITPVCHSMAKKETNLRWSQSVVKEQNVRFLKNLHLITWSPCIN